MREIKFRAFQDEKMLISPISSNYGLARLFGFLYEDSPIMQFTGLKDMNGKDVYEGDILRCSHDSDNPPIVFAVEFKNGAYTIEWSGMFYEDSDMTTIGWAMEQGFEFEVIGNIYENPELLKP